MTTPYDYSWRNVERGLFEYWLKVLGGVENITAYTFRNLPKTISENEIIWRFSVNGPGRIVPRQTRVQVNNGAWDMDGLFEAWCLSDDTAMEIGGIIMQNNPVLSTDVAGLSRCQATGYPAREPDVIRLSDESNAGQEVLCVRLFVPFQVAFSNTEQRT